MTKPARAVTKTTPSGTGLVWLILLYFGVLAASVILAELVTRPSEKTKLEWLILAGSVVTGPAIVITLGLAMRTYRQNVEQQRVQQLWKQKEFVATSWQKALSSEGVQLGLMCLDYNERTYHLPHKTSDLEVLRITDALTEAALIPHSYAGTSSAEVRAARDAIDAAVSEIDRLCIFITAGLIAAEDLRPYVSYWADLLIGESRHRSEEFKAAVRLNLDEYGYAPLVRVLGELGFSLTPRPNDDQTVARAVATGKYNGLIAPAE